MASAAGMAASSIAACYVILEKHTPVWRPLALSWLEAGALFGLLAAGLARAVVGGIDERRFNWTVDALIVGLGIATAIVLAIHELLESQVVRWSMAATILGLAVGITALLTDAADAENGSRTRPVTGNIFIVAIVWSAALVVQDLGNAAPSAGWLAFGRWLLPLSVLGMVSASSDLRLPRSFLRWTRRFLRPAVTPSVWIVPVALCAATVLAWNQDAAIAGDLALCAALAVALLGARQAVSLRLERTRVRALLELSVDLERAANIDRVTGIPNRAALDARLEQEMERAVRYRQSLSICCIDVDHFKQVNDLHGHATGDAALRAIAVALQRTGRSIDFVARAGGEEFVVIAPGTWSADALVLGERLRAQIEELSFQTRRGEPLGLTVSVGIAAYPEHGASPSELLEYADEALYVSKQLGRNRVTLWQPVTED